MTLACLLAFSDVELDILTGGGFVSCRLTVVSQRLLLSIYSAKNAECVYLKMRLDETHCVIVLLSWVCCVPKN
jgi:hypothetical protein